MIEWDGRWVKGSIRERTGQRRSYFPFEAKVTYDGQQFYRLCQTFQEAAEFLNQLYVDHGCPKFIKRIVKKPRRITDYIVGGKVFPDSYAARLLNALARSVREHHVST